MAFMLLVTFICLSTALSDGKAQEVIDKALEESSIDIRNIVSVLTGLMGSGKTCLLSRIFNQPPPSVYTSTGVAEQSLRGWLHHMGSMSSSCSWKPFSHENVLEFVGQNFYQGFVQAEIARESLTSHTSSAGTAPSCPACRYHCSIFSHFSHIYLILYLSCPACPDSCYHAYCRRLSAYPGQLPKQLSQCLH